MLAQLASRSASATAARVKMEEVIQTNLSQTVRVIEQVERTVIDDRVARGTKLEFGISNIDLLAGILENSTTPPATRLEMTTPDGAKFSLHENAVSQLSERAGVPIRFANDLTSRGVWGTELLAENFRRIYGHGNGARYLVRSVGDEVRGFLSDKYRRLDVRPLLDAFIGVCHNVGAVPVQGFALDTRVGMRAILPVVFEPIPGECLVFGVNWQNSDFGRGANSLSLFLMRLWCLNGATLDEVLKQVHLGRKLDDNIEYSRETVELDTRANVSKLKDVVRYAFCEKNVELTLAAIKKAGEQQINPKEALKLLKNKMSAGEAALAIEAYNSPDVVNLPQGNSIYRLSNAVSWISQAESVTTERRMELDRFAGELLGNITNSTAVEV